MPTRISLLRGINNGEGGDGFDWGGVIKVVGNVVAEIIKNNNKQGSPGAMPQDIFEDWYDDQVRNWAGRFSEQTKIWPVPDNLVPAEWIANQVRSNHYEDLVQIVAQRGREDGIKYNQDNQDPGTDDEDQNNNNSDGDGGNNSTPEAAGGIVIALLGLGLFLGMLKS